MRNVKIIAVLILPVLFVVLGFGGSVAAHAATMPALGAAATYGVLSSTFANGAAGTTVNGDVGFTTGPAAAPAGVHTNYGSNAPYATAGTDQGSALTALNAQPCDFNFGAATALNSLPQPLVPGVYCITGAVSVGTAGVTLSGSGVYIFRSVGALNTAAGATVNLAGGATACNIFWTPTGATTLGASTSFAGTIISNAGITMGAGSTLMGRALAFSGTVTTDSNTITVPSCTPPPASLRVIKQVVNQSGGTATASSFVLHIKLSGVDVAGSPALGVTAPGTAYTLFAGTYMVSEDVNPSYTKSFSGDCDASGAITLVSGDSKTCTITNTDIAPATLHVIKTVINDNSGTKTIIDFPLFVNGTSVTSGTANTLPVGTYIVTETPDAQYTRTFSGDCDIDGRLTLNQGEHKYCIITNNDVGTPAPSTVPPRIKVVKVPSPLALPAGPGAVIYSYTLRNTGTVPVTNIAMVGDSCVPITLISGDSNGDAKLDVSELWIYHCSATLTKTHTNTIVAIGWANGVSTTDIASATVVVAGVVSSPTAPFSLEIMKQDADFIALGSFETLAAQIAPKVCELSEVQGKARVAALFTNQANESVLARIAAFTACGTVSTISLGAGERLGVVASFKAAYGYLPSTSAEWSDVVKIANGRYPAKLSTSAETSAKASFQKVYLRSVNMLNERDKAAVTVMAYGLRPNPRNMNSEKVAIATFRSIFKMSPVSAAQWDTVRAIAYSGATR